MIAHKVRLFHFCPHLKRNCNSKINNFLKFPSINSIQNEKIQNDTILNFTAPFYKRQKLVKSSTVYMAIPRYHRSEFFLWQIEDLQQLNKICWSFHINHRNLDKFPKICLFVFANCNRIHEIFALIIYNS